MPEERTPCRDFERGVCSRGDNCRYYHPEGLAPAAEGGKLPICKDYQNKECLRFKCKFLHITKEEEEEYNKSGTLPEHGGEPQVSSSRPSGHEVCKDFLNGNCDRGSRCKFSHAAQVGYEMGLLHTKRPRVDDFHLGALEGNRAAITEENERMRQKVTSLQKEVIDLRQMNDTLYDQNAKYRTHLCKGGAPASQVNAYSSAAVTYPQYPQTAYPTTAYPTAAALPAYTAYTY